jgi:hypothetical protein
LAGGIPRQFGCPGRQKHNYFASAPEEVHKVVWDFLRE